MDGNALHVHLEEYENEQTPRLTASRQQPLGEHRDALFVVEADDATGLRAGLRRLRTQLEQAAGSVPTLARAWFAVAPLQPQRRLAVALVAGSREELRSQLQTAEASLEQETKTRSERLFLMSASPGGSGRLAFVFPGSGNHFPDMGRQLGVAWPGVLRRQDAENERLREQHGGRNIKAANAVTEVPCKAMMFGQVALGTLVCDLLADFGIRPAAVLGYSLGESAALFGLRAWTARDEMLRRMQASDLFGNELVGECKAATSFLGLAAGTPVSWRAVVVPCTPEAVRRAIGDKKRLYLLLINTPSDCVVGGAAAAIEQLVRELGCSMLTLPGASTVHCEIAQEVAESYRELHLLPTTPLPNVRFYSSAWAAAYEVSRERAADAILAQALQTVDFPAVVNQAYADGVRLFIEVGPGASCTRWIDRILGQRPHLARAVCVQGQDAVASVLRAGARQLIVERIPVDLVASVRGYRDEARILRLPSGMLCFPVSRPPFQPPPPPRPERTSFCGKAGLKPLQCGSGSGDPLMHQFTATTSARNHAHDAHLRFSARLTQLLADQMSLQMSLLEAGSPAALPRLATGPRQRATPPRLCSWIAASAWNSLPVPSAPSLGQPSRSLMRCPRAFDFQMNR